MHITDVHLELLEHGRMRAAARIVLDDCFIVRDLKVIEGPQGLFVAMPTRKVMIPCPHCRLKNVRDAIFCNNCGRKLPQPQYNPGAENRLHMDVAHPINVECRRMIERAVINAYTKEISERGA